MFSYRTACEIECRIVSFVATMKHFVNLCLLLSLVVTARGQINMNLQRIIKDCFAELKVPTELQQANPTNLLIDPTYNCFTACLMKKKGTMNNGKIVKEKKLAVMHQDIYDALQSVAKICAITANQQMDECDVAVSYGKCMIKNLSAFQG